ncbi:MAG: hypothetical protein HOW73_27600 [Polyangiaceae bacterium]|nr:hypothetical protein [Polyangiaceae bacterium]
MKKKIAMLCAGLFVFTMAGVASADDGDGYVTQDETDGYSVKFLDDLLDGAGLDGSPPMLTVRPRGVRMTLIRPRTSFVNEMLKSVESF